MIYPISYRQLAEMVSERGIIVDHTTIFRWIQHYAPEFEKRIRWYARPSSGSLRVNETYIKTIDFMLSHKRDITAAKRFFKKVLKQCKQMPSNITTDKHAPYKTAIEELKNEGIIGQNLNHRTLKGIEAMAMMIKEQTIYLSKDYQNQIQFFNRLFNVYA